MTARRLVLVLAIAVCGLGAGRPVCAEDADTLMSRSLPMRTALHHDATMKAPFEKLLELYRKDNRVDELVAMYRSHLSQFPQDQNATIVLIRLLSATGNPEAMRAAQTAVRQFPENAFIHYLLYEMLDGEQDPEALSMLDKAAELEQLPSRKETWIDELVPKARAAGDHEMAEKHLRALGALYGDSSAGRLQVARRMLDHKFPKLALETLAGGDGDAASGVVMLESEMVAASAEAALDRHDQAIARLDALLGRVSADHWMRDEILRRMAALVKTDAQRQAMIDAARQRVEASPNDEHAVLELATRLSGFEFRRQALDVLLEAGKRLPQSLRIEKATLELFDLLRDERGRELYLAARIKQLPERGDLVLERVKTLYLLGRSHEATEALDELVADLDEPDRLRILLDVGRYLRRTPLPDDAMRVLNRAVQLAPDRLDIMREVGELCLVTGDREALRKLFTREIPEAASIENLLDLVQFMVRQRMWREARQALARRMATEPNNLELRLLLLEVEASQGRIRAAESLIVDMRELADTTARYRQWLEAAAQFHDRNATIEGFLEQELTRLATSIGQWESQLVERRIAWAEMAMRFRMHTHALTLLRSDLEKDPPRAIAIKLRRRIIAVLGDMRGGAEALRNEFKSLAQLDPASTNEINARLAILHVEASRDDLAQPLLQKVDVAAINDADLLARLRRIYATRNDGRQAIAVMRRLTVIDPTNRNNWEQWLSALAGSGNEEHLRIAIRRLLAGVERMPLTDEARGLLKTYLVDSYWRSIAGAISDGQAGSLAESLALLDAVDRMIATPHEGIWIVWTRAYVLNQLGRGEARDEAIRELDRLAKMRLVALAEQQPAQPDEEGEATTDDDGSDSEEHPTAAASRPDVIVFPDGMSISVKWARKLLAAELADQPNPPFNRAGPMPSLQGLALRWVHRVDAGMVTRLMPLSDGRLLVFNTQGDMTCLAGRTGKLIWERSGVLPPTSLVGQWVQMMSPTGGYTSHYVTPMVPSPVRAGEDRIIVASGGSLSCWDLNSGELAWRAELASSHAAPAQIVVRGDLVVAVDAVSGEALWLDRETGKLKREAKQLFDPQAGPSHAQQDVGSTSDGRFFFVYGSQAGIYDIETGDAVWRFAPSEVRAFPLELKDPQDVKPKPKKPASGATSVSPYAFTGPAMPPMSPHVAVRAFSGAYLSSHGHGPFGGPSGSPFGSALVPFDYLKRSIHSWQPGGDRIGARVAYMGPVVFWAAQTSNERIGLLVGDRLVLGANSQLGLHRLDMPLLGKQVSVSGTYIGRHGRLLCMMQHAGALAVVDTRDGNRHDIAIGEVSGNNPQQYAQCVLDGPLAYVSGPKGLLCVNITTRTKVFMCEWPEELRESEEEDEALASNVPGPSPHMVGMMGLHHMARRVSAPHTAHHQVVQYKLNGVSFQINGNQGAALPMAAAARDGVLYTLLEPGVLVAVEAAETEADADDG